MTAGLPREVEEAVYTACSELPGEHPDDIEDCVCGMIPWGLFQTHRVAIAARIRQLI